MKLTNSFIKITLYNIGFLSLLLIVFAAAFEIITRSHNPFSLFPKQLTDAKSIKVLEDEVNFADAKPLQSAYEAKTNVYYTHNKYGLRASKVSDIYSFHPSVDSNYHMLSVGDSTNYGLNLPIESTFSYLSAKKSNVTLVNTSYPGININGIHYKLSCAKKLHDANVLNLSDIVISFYYNDLETLSKLPLDSSNCTRLSDLNLLRAPSSQYVNNIQKNSPFSLFQKLVSFSSYPRYINKLFCKDLFPKSCKYVKFALANSSPYLRNIIFGTTRNNFNLTSIHLLDERLDAWIDDYNSILSEFSPDIRISLLYIPRNELDLGILDSKRELMFGFFKTLCQSNPRLRCFDGSIPIINSLSESQLSDFKKSFRLPSKYYSYLPIYDLGHPSKFVSGLYSDVLTSHDQ